MLLRGAYDVSHDAVTYVFAGHHLIDFWTNMCLNHNLITEGELDTEDFRSGLAHRSHSQPCLVLPSACSIRQKHRLSEMPSFEFFECKTHHRHTAGSPSNRQPA